MDGCLNDVVFDVVARRSFSGIKRSLNENGRYLMVNPRLFKMVRGLWTSMTSRKKVIIEFANYRAEDLLFPKQLIETEKLTPVIDRHYPLEEIAEAHKYGITPLVGSAA
ncbi:MAG: zinc-binding dehydrogenase [Gammaproteobacteria bacterium]|nr:zinc-binding dehydrogenase [Gammaproteobacteria bacterium]